MEQQENVFWDTNKMIQKAGEWSLAGDVAVLNFLKNFSEKVLTETEKISESVDHQLNTLHEVSLKLDLVKNEFHSLRNSQFIESRVYEDDETADNIQNDKQKIGETLTEDQKQDRIKNAILRGANLIKKYYEKVVVDVSDSDDEIEKSYVLKPKDLYSNRPLPYIVGTEEWHKKWHVGLLLSESDSESEKEAEVYSSSDSESGLPKDRVPVSETSWVGPAANSTFNDTIDRRDDIIHSGESDSQHSFPVQAPISNKNFAEQLAEKLGNVIGAEKSSDNNHNANKITAANIFSDEPPPLDDELEDTILPKSARSGLFSGGGDIFGKDDDEDLFWKPQSTADKTRQADDIGNKAEAKKGIFAPSDDSCSEEDEFEKLFKKNKGTTKKPYLLPTTTSNLPPMINDEPPELIANTNKVPSDKKKPIGGVSIFGDSTNLFSDIASKTKIQSQTNKSADNILSTHNLSEKDASPKESQDVSSKKSSLFNESDDDIANNKIKNVSTKKTNTSKKTSLFDESDDETFSPIGVKKQSIIGDRQKTDKKMNLFDSDDNEDSNIFFNIKRTIPKKKTSLFDSDNDLSSSEGGVQSQENNAINKKLVEQQKNANIFDSDSEFTEKKKGGLSKLNKKTSLFDKDESADGVIQNQTTENKAVTPKPQSSASFLDRDIKPELLNKPVKDQFPTEEHRNDKPTAGDSISVTSQSIEATKKVSLFDSDHEDNSDSFLASTSSSKPKNYTSIFDDDEDLFGSTKDIFPKLPKQDLFGKLDKESKNLFDILKSESPSTVKPQTIQENKNRDILANSSNNKTENENSPKVPKNTVHPDISDFQSKLKKTAAIFYSSEESDDDSFPNNNNKNTYQSSNVKNVQNESDKYNFKTDMDVAAGKLYLSNSKIEPPGYEAESTQNKVETKSESAVNNEASIFDSLQDHETNQSQEEQKIISEEESLQKNVNQNLRDDSKEKSMFDNEPIQDFETKMEEKDFQIRLDDQFPDLSGSFQYPKINILESSVQEHQPPPHIGLFDPTPPPIGDTSNDDSSDGFDTSSINDDFGHDLMVGDQLSGMFDNEPPLLNPNDSSGIVRDQNVTRVDTDDSSYFNPYASSSRRFSVDVFNEQESQDNLFITKNQTENSSSNLPKILEDDKTKDSISNVDITPSGNINDFLSSSSVFDKTETSGKSDSTTRPDKKESIFATSEDESDNFLFNPTKKSSVNTSSIMENSVTKSEPIKVKDEVDKVVSTRELVGDFESQQEDKQNAKTENDIFQKPKLTPPKKLRHNLQINVGALMPGAPPPKFKGVTKSVSFEDTDVKKYEEKYKSVSFDDTDVKKYEEKNEAVESSSGILTSVTKDRAKIPVKRRPSTRKGRRESIRNSIADFRLYQDNSPIADPIENNEPNITNNNAPVSETGDASENKRNNLQCLLDDNTKGVSLVYNNSTKNGDVKKRNSDEIREKHEASADTVSAEKDISILKPPLKTSIFDDDSSSDGDELFKSSLSNKPKMNKQTEKSDLFDDSTPNKETSKPAQSITTASSLFSDDNQDDDDLFSVTKSEHLVLKSETKDKLNSLFDDNDDDLFGTTRSGTTSDTTQPTERRSVKTATIKKLENKQVTNEDPLQGFH